MPTPGDKIKALLVQRDMTQAQLADQAGVDRGTLNDLVRGRSKSGRLDTVARLARALGVTPEWLLDPTTLDLPDASKTLTGHQRAILTVFGFAEQHGWEEVARRCETKPGEWEDAKPIKRKG